MENIICLVKGDKLHIEIDLSRDLGPSASGKTQMVATTRGNYRVPGTEVTIGLNAFRKA